MSQTARQLAAQINSLLDELVSLADGGNHSSARKKIKHHSARAIDKTPKGAAGAINMLVAEGFFDEPKELPTVMGRLKEIGHYHKQNAVSMNLLNMTKRRELNRFKNKETNNWEYVIRK